jgi:hypothetical protein
MSVSTPPPVVVVKEKRGPGCLGCGCGILVLLFVLVAVLLAGLLYEIKQKGTAVTSATAAQIPSFDGGDTMYQAANQKLNDFTDAVQNGQPGHLQLSADEINTLIAHNPAFASYGAHAFVTLQDNNVNLKASLSGSAIPFGLLNGRYGNFEADFTPAYDADNKTLSFTIHQLKSGDQAMTPDQLASLQSEIDALLQIELEQSAAGKNFLDHAKSITIQNGQLDIETQ